ncbi:hypothetical protein OROGR_022409 [Orobanche gracilis]
MEGGRSGDNDGERGGETILVRGMKSGEYGYDHEKRRHYRWLEFHKVDLKEGGELEMNCIPNLLTWMSPGVMLSDGSKVYIIGGLSDEGEQKGVGEYNRYASVLDMKEEEKSWKQFPLPIKYPYNYPRCASLDGKIYHFDYPSEDVDPCSFGPYPEVYDPILGGGFWEFFWCPQIDDDNLTGEVIPDPLNKRILVNLSDGYDLYAYYPLDRTFKLVGREVCPWSHIVALADNIAYVHQPESSQLLHAFDLSDGAKPLDVVWTSKVFPNIVNGVSYDVKLASFEFDALFHVGNNNFWFTYWSLDNHGNSRVYFLKFKALRARDKIICTPLALRSHLLESTCKVFDFLLLEECNSSLKKDLKFLDTVWINDKDELVIDTADHAGQVYTGRITYLGERTSSGPGVTLVVGLGIM